MNKEKLLELSETLRGIAEESNVASFERWHEDGWVNCKFRYRHELQTQPESQKLPLSQDDIEAGAEFQRFNPGNVYQWSEKSANCVKLANEWVNYYSLMDDGWKMRRIGEADWQDCYKLQEK